MSALHALNAARDAGVRIGVDGEALTLDADAAPPEAVLDLLSRHKAEVIACPAHHSAPPITLAFFERASKRFVASLTVPSPPDSRLTTLEGFAWVVTNLPYRDLEELATHLISLGDRDRCGVALLVRTEWIVPKARRKLVHEHPHFAGTVMLTARPRWVERVQDSASPRHNFAWGVWCATPRIGDPWLRFAGR